MELSDLKGITPNRIKALQTAGITKPKHLIYFFPRKYIDRSNLDSIALLTEEQSESVLSVTIQRIQTIGTPRNKRLEAIATDETGTIKLVWFKGVTYFEKTLKVGKKFLIWGQAKRFGTYWSIAHPNMENATDEHQVDQHLRIFAMYPSNQLFEKTYISSELIQKWVKQLLSNFSLKEYLPSFVVVRLHLLSRQDALHAVHFPQKISDSQNGLFRFKFEELFLFQLCVRKIRANRIMKAIGLTFKTNSRLVSSFYNEVLPFELTDGQKKAIEAIRTDFESGFQSNRLIQGDVGSGKTIVAFISMLYAIDNGYQCAFMAPTELLAEQHAQTLSVFAEALGLNVRILTGQQKTSIRNDVLADIAAGTCHIAVGTHALFQNEVEFFKLGLVIVDEQHRFGVLQRNLLALKGLQPHVLVMSATPIPRSLAMTLYGDLDVTLIKGLPKNRKPIKTAMRNEKKRDQVYQFIDDLLADGGQVYIVYPLVQESEVLDLKDATQGFELIKERFSGYSVGLVHGKLPSIEKEKTMQAFKRKELQILVSTTVIEVGVDVPNASLMVIEHAERFGLSQLHQLRGRVGRGERQSYCVLMRGDALSKEGRIRLETMERTNDGFEVAEVDLDLRGPGDLLGTKQSGLPDFKFADLVKDQDILELAKEYADELLETDKDLLFDEHSALKKVFEPYFAERSKFYFTS
ncbi:MAG: ATP-dependent DNA helicase RecG [Bacteroidetes bacterium]|nr:ATP-dependent DNA helicase RecG [Bacteroidota bacterium]NCQ11549.1 ATP-dependent DNA helicase RecG [Bacteroidota bacterium]